MESVESISFGVNISLRNLLLVDKLDNFIV
jgi:hypothetical protein